MFHARRPAVAFWYAGYCCRIFIWPGSDHLKSGHVPLTKSDRKTDRNATALL
jgi:hypothetical protein